MKKMWRKMCLRKNRLYLAFLLSTLLFFSLLWVLYSINQWDNVGALITVFGGLYSFLYFTQKQQIEDLSVFKELFDGFNKRYDSMNEDLNKIIRKDDDIEINDRENDILNDYFNLCGEQYLYYKRGFIYQEVWDSWHRGMMIFYEHPRIRDLWDKELETGSYYGLSFEKDTGNTKRKFIAARKK